MDALTTAEAAERAGVSIRRWHYLTTKHDIQPARKLAGIRGGKLWDRRAVRRVAKIDAVAA